MLKIKLDKILGLLRESDESDGTSLYHLQSGESVQVAARTEYFIACELILDTGSSFEIDSGGRLVLHDGPILNSGVITNNGIIKIGL